LVLLLLTHLLIFAPMRTGTRIAFIVIAFGSALLMEAASWMVRFWHPGFAWLKVSMFLVFQAMLAYLILGLGGYLAAAPLVGNRKRAGRMRTHRARRRRGIRKTPDASQDDVPGS
jgi:hypothetical protein